MNIINENLWHGTPAARSFQHFIPPLVIAINLVLNRLHAFSFQEIFRPDTIGADLC